jgi:hypothetical protein
MQVSSMSEQRLASLYEMLKLAERKKLSFPRSYLLAALKNSLLQAA